MAPPWLHIVGIHPSGLAALSEEARLSLDTADVIFGSQRHLDLAEVSNKGCPWPVPFSIEPLLAHRGKSRVAALVSGDPFFFGAGSSLAKHMAPTEWRNHPQPSTFSWIAGELGWPLEATHCVGLHARPLASLTRLLQNGERFICLLRDGPAMQLLASWLTQHGWGNSPMWAFSQVAGPQADSLQSSAHALAGGLHSPHMRAPVAVAFVAAGGKGFMQVAGRDIDQFAHDGQITKGPVRAMTLAALQPRRGDLLWDLGAGSGSVAIEWCLAGGRAVCVEQQASRVANIQENARRYDADLQVFHGQSQDLLAHLPQAPDSVFVGGGFSMQLFEALRQHVPTCTRLVVNAVTLETHALLISLHQAHGGQLVQLQWSEAADLGRMQGWQANRLLVQWTWIKA